jgi:nucleoside-diphosphate-sugar epimerase
MRVLLTGALGNIGSHTVRALLEEGHDVVAFDRERPAARRTTEPLGDRVRVVSGDITDRTSLCTALEGVDAVVHMAAIIPPHVDKAPDVARRTNVDATLALIRSMESSPTAKRLVFASSAGVFGNIQDREPPLRADTPPSPTDDYGRHKLECEQAIQRSGLRWSILRIAVAVPTKLIGAPHDPGSAFEGSVDGRLEIVHPADAATAFARAVTCEAAIGRILNIGGGARCQTTNHQFFNELMGAIGIGPIPIEAFVQCDTPRFYGDWIDTEESQRLFRYQTRGIGELKAELVKGLGFVAPLIRWCRPVATWYLLRMSPYLQENRSRRINHP